MPSQPRAVALARRHRNEFGVAALNRAEKPLGHWAVRAMSGQQRANRNDLPACPRCKAQMMEVVSIAPMLHEPGLIAYECSKCGYLTSVVQPPTEPQRE
jgi:hypothetical protein